VASVAPGGPIQFCVVRNSPGALAVDVSPCSRRWCKLPHQTQVQGQLGDTLDARRRESRDVAHPGELVDVGAGGSRGDLVEQDLRQAHVGALDARAAEGFLAQERRAIAAGLGSSSPSPDNRTKAAVGT